MKLRLIALSLALASASAACGKRQVEVGTAAPQPSPISVEVKNNVNQAVNVYITTGGNDTFLKQVPANNTATIPVQGFPAGTTVGLRATTIDGARTYSRSNVVLNGTYVFALP